MSISFLIDRLFIKRPKFRETITKLVYGQTDRDVDLLGAVIRINALKENGYLRASIVSKRYSLLRDELSVLINLSSLMGDKITFLDVGANIGIYSIAMARIARLYPTMEVIAFEVDPETYTRLNTNALEYGFAAYNFGLSDTSALKREFVRGAVSHVTTLREKLNSYSIPNRIFLAELKRLDEIDFGDNQLVIKIDVEGQELNVLNGAINYLSKYKINAIYFDGIAEFSETLEMLSDFGFECLNGRTLGALNNERFSVLAVKRGLGKRTDGSEPQGPTFREPDRETTTGRRSAGGA